MYICNEQSVAQTVRAIKEQWKCIIQPHRLHRLVKNSLEHYQHLSRDADMEAFSGICLAQFTDFSLEEELMVTDEETADPVSGPSPIKKVSATDSPSSSSSVLPALSHATPGTSKDLSTPAMCTPLLTATFPSSSTRSLQGRGQLTPREVQLKKRLDFVSKSKMEMMKRYQTTINKLKSNVDKSKNIKVKYLKQDILRKKAIISRNKDKIKDLKIKLSRGTDGEELERLKNELRKMKKRNNRLLRDKKAWKSKAFLTTQDEELISLQAQVYQLKAQIQTKNEANSELQNENLSLTDTLKELEGSGSFKGSMKKEGKQFSTQMRMFVYDAITNNVATKNVPTLIEKFAKHAGLNIVEIPHRSTVELMTREVGVISDLQAAEFMVENKNLTLGFDATTQEGVHVNEVHVTGKEVCHVLALDRLAGGTAEDYELHITQSVDTLAEVYSAYHEADYNKCRSDLIASVSNTITDRAAVNHATESRLEKTWEKYLNKLNCHLHPLEAISSSCKSALKAVEDEGKKNDPSKFQKKLGGTESIAANLIWEINKIRYKDGSGDPKGFVNALVKANLPKGLLPRFRGNRLHILFHISGVLVQHYDFFRNYFDSGSVKSDGQFLKKLLQDFKSPVAQVEFQVLGLLGKLLTAPWMSRFYTSPDAQISHLDGIVLVKKVLEKVKSTVPEDTLTTRTDFFEKDLADTDVLKILQRESVDKVLFISMMRQCLDSVVAVLERQYSRYFDTDITDILRQETESARSHNIDAEQIMGMFSAAKERSPNATLCYMSCKIRAQKNKVVEYLDQLDSEKREKVIKLAVCLGRKQLVKRRKKSVELRKEIGKRLAAKTQKKDANERCKIEVWFVEPDWQSKILLYFPDIEEHVKMDIQEILDGKVVGRSICHIIWCDLDAQEHTVYNGKVEKLLNKKGGTYVVAYWLDDETYDDDAADFDVSKFAMATDLVCGDLTLF